MCPSITSSFSLGLWMMTEAEGLPKRWWGMPSGTMTFGGLLANGLMWQILNLLSTLNRRSGIKSEVVERSFGEHRREIYLGKAIPCLPVVHTEGSQPKNV